MLCPLFSIPSQGFTPDDLNHLGASSMQLQGIETKMDLI